MLDFNKLINGFRVFKSTKYQINKDLITHLQTQGQKPSTMVISSCDIKISPAEIFSVNPGELFVLNNIGGLVPKYQTEGISGIMSALEYAVNDLEVENIMILGHSKSISAKMIMSEDFVEQKSKISEAMKKWLSIASEARDAVKKQLSQSNIEEQQVAFEKEAIIISLRNLLTYPYIKERVEKNKLKIFAWQFDFESGDVLAFNTEKKIFESIS